MSRNTLLHLTMTSDAEGSAWLAAEAMDRFKKALHMKMSEAMLAAKGPITLTLELYMEESEDE